MTMLTLSFVVLAGSIVQRIYLTCLPLHRIPIPTAPCIVVMCTFLVPNTLSPAWCTNALRLTYINSHQPIYICALTAAEDIRSTQSSAGRAIHPGDVPHP